MPNAESWGVDIGLVRELTSLAFEFGPFLFTILLLIFITARARRYYNEVCTRDPPAAEDERSTHRRIYYASWVVSFVLVAVSTGWWMWKDNVRVFRFAIYDLKPAELLTTIDNTIYKRIMFEENARGKNYLFLINSAASISADSPIQIRYFNGETETEKILMVDHKGVNDQIFILDRSSDELQLKRYAHHQPSHPSLIGQARAAPANLQRFGINPVTLAASNEVVGNPLRWDRDHWSDKASKGFYTEDPSTKSKEIENRYKIEIPLKRHEFFQIQEQLYLQKMLRGKISPE